MELSVSFPHLFPVSTSVSYSYLYFALLHVPEYFVGSFVFSYEECFVPSCTAVCLGEKGSKGSHIFFFFFKLIFHSNWHAAILHTILEKFSETSPKSVSKIGFTAAFVLFEWLTVCLIKHVSFHLYVCTVFVTLGATVALNLGKETNWMMFENLMGYFLFYCAHWQTYVSGTLRFYK